MNKEIITSIAAMIAAINKLCCTVAPSLMLPIILGINVAPSKPTENIIPKMLPYILGSNLPKVTPIIVGKMGAKAKPISITAIMPKAGLLAIIISPITSRDKIDIITINFDPMAVKFLIEAERNLPVIIATPNKLNTTPVFADEPTVALPA